MFSVSGDDNDENIQSALDEFRMLTYGRQQTVAKIIKIFNEEDNDERNQLKDILQRNEPID
tara:strand:+ start:4045 stop:4227 length:183 start_codon:yes stop_codon:yes gene_type:complete